MEKQIIKYWFYCDLFVCDLVLLARELKDNESYHFLNRFSSFHVILTFRKTKIYFNVRKFRVQKISRIRPFSMEFHFVNQQNLFISQDRIFTKTDFPGVTENKYSQEVLREYLFPRKKILPGTFFLENWYPLWEICTPLQRILYFKDSVNQKIDTPFFSTLFPRISLHPEKEDPLFTFTCMEFCF